MLPDISSAVRLQELDIRLTELAKEIASLPKHIAEIEKKLEAHQRKLEADRAALTANQKDRKKLEGDPSNPALIKTVRGGGYVFATSVTVG